VRCAHCNRFRSYYQVPTTNLLHLWKAEATELCDFEEFNVGDYYGAVEQKVSSETVSKVRYR